MSAPLLSGAARIARTPEPRAMLRRFLALDSLVTTANGLAYAAFAAPSAVCSASGRTCWRRSASCWCSTAPRSGCWPHAGGPGPSRWRL